MERKKFGDLTGRLAGKRKMLCFLKQALGMHDKRRENSKRRLWYGRSVIIDP